MEQKLKVGDKVQVRSRGDRYDGLTGIISVPADEHGFFRVNIDPDPDWSRRHNHIVETWNKWYFRGDKLEKIAPVQYTPGQRIIVKGAEGLSDLFNGLVGKVVKQVDESGPYLCEFDEKANVFGPSVKRIVLPAIWMTPAPQEEPAVEDKSVALAALLQTYRLEDRRRNVVSSSTLDKHRAAEVLALLESSGS